MHVFFALNFVGCFNLIHFAYYSFVVTENEIYFRCQPITQGLLLSGNSLAQGHSFLKGRNLRSHYGDRGSRSNAVRFDSLILFSLVRSECDHRSAADEQSFCLFFPGRDKTEIKLFSVCRRRLIISDNFQVSDSPGVDLR